MREGGQGAVAGEVDTLRGRQRERSTQIPEVALHPILVVLSYHKHPTNCLNDVCLRNVQIMLTD